MHWAKPCGGKIFKQRTLTIVSDFKELKSISGSKSFAVTIQVCINERRLATEMIVQPLGYSLASANGSADMDDLVSAVTNDIDAMLCRGDEFIASLREATSWLFLKLREQSFDSFAFHLETKP